MPLDIRFTSDIEAMLTGIAYGMLSASMAAGENVEYRRGITDTIRAMAEASGVDWGDLAARIERAMSDNTRCQT